MCLIFVDRGVYNQDMCHMTPEDGQSIIKFNQKFFNEPDILCLGTKGSIICRHSSRRSDTLELSLSIAIVAGNAGHPPPPATLLLSSQSRSGTWGLNRLGCRS